MSAKTGAHVEELFDKVVDVHEKKSINAGNFILKESESMIVE